MQSFSVSLGLVSDGLKKQTIESISWQQMQVCAKLTIHWMMDYDQVEWNGIDPQP